MGASIFLIGLHATFYNYDALGINDQAPLTGQIVEEVWKHTKQHYNPLGARDKTKKNSDETPSPFTVRNWN